MITALALFIFSKSFSKEFKIKDNSGGAAFFILVLMLIVIVVGFQEDCALIHFLTTVH